MVSYNVVVAILLALPALIAICRYWHRRELGTCECHKHCKSLAAGVWECNECGAVFYGGGK
jgi:hypothetical protein